MSELKITKERVLEAAESCGDAKEVLKKLFPEVFKEKSKYYDSSEIRLRVARSDIPECGWRIEVVVGGKTMCFIGPHGTNTDAVGSLEEHSRTWRLKRA